MTSWRRSRIDVASGPASRRRPRLRGFEPRGGRFDSVLEARRIDFRSGGHREDPFQIVIRKPVRSGGHARPDARDRDLPPSSSWGVLEGSSIVGHRFETTARVRIEPVRLVDDPREFPEGRCEVVLPESVARWSLRMVLHLGRDPDRLVASGGRRGDTAGLGPDSALSIKTDLPGKGPDVLRSRRSRQGH